VRRAVAIFVFAAAAYVALHRAYRPSPTAVTTPQSAASPATQAPAKPRVLAPDEAHDAAPPTGEDDPSLAIQRHARDVHVDGSGMVVSVLRDDNDGERHQRILVRLPRGETVLIAHNIDIAPRVNDLRPGDLVQFAGEYVWNDKGGVVHWTHHDPSGRHRTGYLLVRGHRYQ
jgi:uncharacterized protein DUF3465